MPTAIVTGATGINGREIIKKLAQDPQKWSKVFAYSRSQKEHYPQNITHEHIDLTASAEELAKKLKPAADAGVEYVFFAAYLEKKTEKEMVDVNGAMLRNFLKGLEIAGADKTLKRVILTTGAKQYGVHLGPTKNPMEEEDEWLTASDRPPNFYYVQQDILKETSAGKNWQWVVTYPNDVIGVAKGNFMNLTAALGIYAAVCAHSKQPLIFPGPLRFYTGFDCFTSADLHAEFNLWAALAPDAGNQAFNTVNGDVQSWSTLWPKLARKFGATVPSDQFSDSFASSLDNEITDLEKRPPVDIYADRMGIRGTDKVDAGHMIARVNMRKWAEKDETKRAWEEVAEKHGLEKDALQKSTWSFLNFVLGRDYDVVISMSKARKMGWIGYKDSWDSLNECLDELVKEKVLPPIQ